MLNGMRSDAEKRPWLQRGTFFSAVWWPTNVCKVLQKFCKVCKLLQPRVDVRPGSERSSIITGKNSCITIQHGQDPQGVRRIIVCYFGVIVIATNGDIFSMQFENPFGVFLMLVSTVIWSLFWLFNTKNSNDSLVSLFVIFLFSFPLISLDLPGNV